jgi:hypothetical protein
VRKVGCFGLSWEERSLLEEAIKHEVNKLRNAIDIVVKVQSEEKNTKRHFLMRYEAELKLELV